MSVSVLLDDKIKNFFEVHKDLNNITENKFNLAVVHFCNCKYLFDTDFNELVDGITDGSGDRAIDMIYIFKNGKIFNPLEAYTICKDDTVKIKFFQVKETPSFSDNEFLKIQRGITDIFKLNLDLDQVQANQKIKEKAEIIRKLFREASLKEAKTSCEIFYCTTSPISVDNKTINMYVNEIKQHLNEMSINTECFFLGAQDLLSLTKQKDEMVELKFVQPPLKIQERDINTYGYCGFVDGNSLIRAFIDEKNSFKEYLMEGNVRFFLGESKLINSEIISTAEDIKKSNYFWAMNNGLTIIAEAVNQVGTEEYNIKNPQVVNGCQTIHCLYEVYKKQSNLPEKLKVFVKLVYAESENVSLDIIRATNSQNAVKSSDLKANDPIQKNIEDLLLKENIYYERRRNYYKRKGKTGTRLISIELMTQILHTVINNRSVEAMNNVSKIIDDEKKYKAIFDSSCKDIDVYKFSALLYTKVWTMKNSYLRSIDDTDSNKRIIGKSMLPILNIMSIILLDPLNHKKINILDKKNIFIQNKKNVFKKLENDEKMQDYFDKSIEIFINAKNQFIITTNKSELDLVKTISFDSDYLLPNITSYFKDDTTAIKKTA